MATPRLSGQVALVTGASRGIRREVALTFALERVSVGVNHTGSGVSSAYSRVSG
jgi:NAD(P)-dependent dehydrogenase (short-subunit alcohol dehydrogenase family)